MTLEQRREMKSRIESMGLPATFRNGSVVTLEVAPRQPMTDEQMQTLREMGFRVMSRHEAFLFVGQ